MKLKKGDIVKFNDNEYPEFTANNLFIIIDLKLNKYYDNTYEQAALCHSLYEPNKYPREFRTHYLELVQRP